MNWTHYVIEFVLTPTRDKRTSSSCLFSFFFYLTPNIYTSGPELRSIIQSRPFTTLLHTLSVLVTKETVKWSLGSGAMVWHECFLFIYFISFLSLSTSCEWNITTWTNDCVFVILQVKEARHKCLTFPVPCAACKLTCKRPVMSQTLSPDPHRPTCSHHFLSLWSHNSWRDASTLPLAMNLSAAIGKCVF